MSFSQENGYVPNTISALMALVREGINTQFGTAYTAETFEGTNFYKYFYALVQRLQENEVKTSEIVLKLQQYFAVTNEIITRPNTTNPGVVDYLTAAGYVASVKAPIDADAGKAYICVDLDDAADDYEDKKLEVCELLSKSIVAGVITQGTESEFITLSNLQSFEFKFNLPNRKPTELKLTITLSDNNQAVILSTDEVKQKLLDNVTARYRLGLNFEPQRYFSVLDAPWAASVLLEYSFDSGGTWDDAVYVSNYDDLLEFDIETIQVIEV